MSENNRNNSNGFAVLLGCLGIYFVIDKFIVALDIIIDLIFR